MRKINRWLLATLTIGGGIALTASALPSFAQSTESKPGAWQFEVTPYFWMAGMKGDTKIGALPQVALDESFSDLLKILDFGAMATFEMRKDRWGLMVDGIYMKISDGLTATRSGPPPVGATATASANLTIRQSLLTGGVTYRVLEGKTPVDIIGGLRYNKVSGDADVGISFFGPAGLNPSATRSFSDGKSWIIPVIGARIAHPITDRWTLTGYADVGGSSSSNGWQAAAGAAYAYSKDVSFKFGYRELKIDYNKGTFLYDVKMSGPYLAATFGF